MNGSGEKGEQRKKGVEETINNREIFKDGIERVKSEGEEREREREIIEERGERMYKYN